MAEVMALRERLPGAVRQAPRHQAGLHVLLREGGHRRAQGLPGRERRGARHGHRLQGPLRHRRRRRRRQGAGGAGGARRRPAVVRRDRATHRRAGRPRQDNKLALEELEGGTFTISNGGIYGSLLSTPILNPPQSGILGLHAIQKRPVAVGDAVVVRPMMYVALSYDHRLVDGREAVQFLVRVKECIENPERHAPRGVTGALRTPHLGPWDG